MTAQLSTESDRIARMIEADILAGKRAPGSHLNEQELADLYSVSRTPVREAMRYLSWEGLIEVKPRRGAFVAQISTERLLRMFEAMTELEAVCARLAARRMTPEECAALRKVHEDCAPLVNGGDPDAYYETSLQVHRHLFHGAKNEVLAEMALKLFERLTAYRRRQIFKPGRAAASHAEHEAVIEAVCAHDEDKAEELMRNHTSMVGGSVVDLIALLDEPAA